MGLLDRLRDVLRERLGRPPVQKNQAYGQPGRRLIDWDTDYEDAGADISAEMNASFPPRSDAMLRSGFDLHRDYDAERARASRQFSDELKRTWQAGKPYSSWVSGAAWRVGL